MNEDVGINLQNDTQGQLEANHRFESLIPVLFDLTEH